jgi:hypothetical protein
VQGCPVCGRSFDPLGFQVVIPELGRGFDRIECAQSARALATPGSRIAAAPMAAVVAPIAATAAGPAVAMRALSAPAATLGLLAAGAAAAVFLWVRVLGADPARFPFVRADAPPATAGETMEASVSSGGVREAGPANTRVDVPQRIGVALPSTRNGATTGPSTARGPSSPTRHPSSGNGTGQPQQGGKDQPQQGGKNGQDGGKDHPGHGYGHVKHGDTRGNHSPGHGGGAGHSKGNGKGKSNGKGSGNGHGKSQGHGHGHGKNKKH